jgi:hypothetical protein
MKEILNYSKQLIKLIEQVDDANQVPDTNLTLALLGAGSPVEAMNIVVKSCGGDTNKAANVVNDLISTVNFAQQSFLEKVLQIIDTSDDIKSL